MKGWKIFVQSLRLVFANLPEALRISVLPYILVAASLVWLVVEDLPYLDPMAIGMLDPHDFNPLPLITLAILGPIVGLWVAVAWHRFVLLEERGVGPLPRFHGRRMLAYFGKGILVGLLVLIVDLVLGMLIGLFSEAGGHALAAVSMAVTTVLSMLLLYRICAVLPAAALGQPLSLRGAWRGTKGATWSIFVAALLMMIFGFIIQIPANIGGFSAIWFKALWMVAVCWLQLMVGLSMLTTIYGHFVEGRPLG